MRWNNWLGTIQDWLFPLRDCVFCHQRGSYSWQQPWCESCAQAIVVHPAQEHRCRVCGRVLESEAELCRLCAKQPPPFVRGISLGRYEGRLKEAIWELKYHNQKFLASALGCAMAEQLQKYPEFAACEVVIPVPLAKEKLRERGFNQSALLARQIAGEAGLELDTKTLLRLRHTASQTQFHMRERQQNVAGAFHLSSERMRGRTVLLVDDVFTTGATIRECTRVLAEGGAKAVFFLTAAAVPQEKKYPFAEASKDVQDFDEF